MNKTLKYIALGLALMVISLPGFQMVLHPVKEKSLNGAFILAEKPVLSKDNWDSGEYQDQVEKYLKDHTGFRNFLVRLYNQLDYSFFRKANAEGAIIGKNRQLYEYDYIRSWLAIDNPGESFIRKKMNRVKYVQDYLKKAEGIDLVIVFEPGKASFYPESIPEKYTSMQSGPSTYEDYVRIAKETGIDFIDWHAWFMLLKPGSEYPLFPRYGTHWSVYGMKFAADSMIGFVENRRGIDLGAFCADSMETSTTPRDTDDDVAKTMNLLIPPKGEILAYPVFSFDTAGNKDKPMVLAVADSYYWNIFNTRIPKNLFAKEAFWYFNAMVYPDSYTKPLRTEDLDLKAEVEKQDVIFLMITERFIYKFDWTFIDNLYKLYTPEWLKDPVYDNINRIMMHAPWYGQVIEKANKNGISLEEALILDARYVYHTDDTAGFMIRFGPSYYQQMISGNTDWMANIREKAKSGGLPEGQMLEKEIRELFQTNFKSYYELNRGITEKQASMASDPVLMDSVNLLASRFRFDREELLWILAARMYRQDEISRVSEVIRNDEKWLAAVRLKAEERGLTLEEMIYLDAVWVFEQKLK